MPLPQRAMASKGCGIHNLIKSEPRVEDLLWNEVLHIMSHGNGNSHSYNSSSRYKQMKPKQNCVFFFICSSKRFANKSSWCFCWLYSVKLLVKKIQPYLICIKPATKSGFQWISLCSLFCFKCVRFLFRWFVFCLPIFSSSCNSASGNFVGDFVDSSVCW